MEKAFVKFNKLVAFHGDSSCELKNFLTNGCHFKDSLFPVIYAEQVHSKNIKIVTNAKDKIMKYDEFDGFITDRKDISLLVKSADCTPVLFFDFQKQVIGAIHSGREGTRKNISAEMIKMFQTEFASDTKDILVDIGPAISAENYPVDITTFDAFVDSTKIKQKFPYIDIKNVIKEQLIAAGISKKNINVSEICTFADEKYFSYRETKTANRQFSLIRINK